jgi:hypothetical protein
MSIVVTVSHLDALAERAFIAATDHWRECADCDAAGAELAPSLDRLCPQGRVVMRASEAAERNCALATAGAA